MISSLDDRLPTNNGELFLLHSSDRNEFWTALLEKAYAKLNGSYQALDGGYIHRALIDFTGGICEAIDLKEQDPHEIFRQMLKSYKKSAVMACG